MSHGVDLHFNLTAAIGDLEKARRHAIEIVNGEHDACVERLRTVAAVTTEGAPTVSDADAVVFTQQTVNHDSNDVTVGISSGHAEYIRLSKPLLPGTYRVLVLITRVPK